MARTTTPSTRRPLVVLTNDDGVHAPGIRALGRALSAIAEVVVVAPETEQSSTSHALTLSRPLRLREVEPGWHALDGTPADCVYVATLHKALCPRTPSLVVSGVNMGSNLGSDVFYSGTVAGAREGAIRGIPAIAFSMPADEDAKRCARRAATIVGRMLAWRARHPKEVVLFNVNFPRGAVKGTRVTSLGVRQYDDLVEIRHDPRGRQYLWIGGPGVKHPRMPGTDTDAYERGFVSLTPLRMDLYEPTGNEAASMIAGVRR
jgi:5'-nucleotidase